MSDLFSTSDADADVQPTVIVGDVADVGAGGPASADSNISSNTPQSVGLSTTPTIENAQAKEQMVTDEYIQKQIQLGVQKYLSQMSAAAVVSQHDGLAIPMSPPVPPSLGTRGRFESISTETVAATANRTDDNDDGELLETQEVRYQGRGHARARVLVNITPAMLAAKGVSAGSNATASVGLIAIPPLGPSGPTSAGSRVLAASGIGNGGAAASSETARVAQEIAMTERLNNRRETSSISYKDLYSSDRRKPHTQLPEAATFSEARSSFMGSTISTMGLAVGLDTRELWMMSSLRAPGINGLI